MHLVKKKKKYLLMHLQLEIGKLWSVITERMYIKSMSQLCFLIEFYRNEMLGSEGIICR